MDLAPPLTRSPVSPLNSSCPSDRSSLGYPSPDLAAQQYSLSILGAPCSMTPPLESDPSLPSLETMSQPEWGHNGVLPVSCAGSAMPNVVPSEYHSFDSYEVNSISTPHSYGREAYSSHNHPVEATSSSPPPLLMRSRITSSARSTLSYASSAPLSRPPTPRVKMEPAHSEYSQGTAVSHYSSPRMVQAPCSAEVYGYTAVPSSGYLSDTQSSTWGKGYHSAEPEPPYLVPSGQAIGISNERRPHFRGHRLRARKRLTTQEEANFQCDFKGCGKLFSRNYNFKAHMETHDEKREYPFLCPETDCSKRFVRKTDLQRHHQSVHMKERNHKCDYCGRLFARKDTLRRHMEDGCSKRFDIGILDLRTEGYGGLSQDTRCADAVIGHLVPPHSNIPRMAVPSTVNGGILGSATTLRSGDSMATAMHAASAPQGEQGWGR